MLHMGSAGASGAYFDLFYEEGWLDLLQWDESENPPAIPGNRQDVVDWANRDTTL